MTNYQRQISKAINSCYNYSELKKLIQGEFIANGIYDDLMVKAMDQIFAIKEEFIFGSREKSLAFQLCDKIEAFSKLDLKGLGHKDIDNIYSFILFNYMNKYDCRDSGQLMPMIPLAGISKETSDAVLLNFKQPEFTIDTLMYMKIIEDDLKSKGVVTFLKESEIELTDDVLDLIVGFSLISKGNLLSRLKSLRKGLAFEISLKGEIDFEFNKLTIDTFIKKPGSQNYLTSTSKVICIRLQEEGLWDKKFAMLIFMTDNYMVEVYRQLKSPNDKRIFNIGRKAGVYAIHSTILFKDLGSEWIDFVMRNRDNLACGRDYLYLAGVAQQNKKLYKLSNEEVIDFLESPYERFKYY